MFKQTLILLCFILVLANAGYVIQRVYPREDTNCLGTGYPYSSFFENGKCVEPTPRYKQLFSCNSTHATQQVLCNSDCSNCQRSTSLPLRRCADASWARMIFDCVDELPELHKTGIYTRQYNNEQCKHAAGDFGTFIRRAVCLPYTSEKSMYSGFDDKKKVFTQVEYEKRECQGNALRTFEVKLDVCSRIPSNFESLMLKKQPTLFIKFSKK